MSDGAAAILADFRRAIALLAEIDDRAATRTAEALAQWLAGEEFDSAAGLAPGWRRHVQQTARDVALRALVALHPDMDAQALARRIVAGIARAARIRGVRPDGEAGLFYDLARLEEQLRERSWRGAIAEIRGKHNPCGRHDAVRPSANLGGHR